MSSVALRQDSDFDRACELYERIASGGTDEFMVFTVIPGPPPSKARHRTRRNGFTYTDPVAKAAEAATADHLRRLVPEPYTGNVALGCVFYRHDRQRIDTDNMLKHVCDAANKILWDDDSQITAVMGITEYDPENPRTIVVIGRHASTMLRGTDDAVLCVVCGQPFQRSSSSPRKKTCSRTCAYTARGVALLEQLVDCPQCGTPYKRTTKTQRFCSADCARASFQDKRREQAAPRSRCLDCDIELTHTRGGRCRECWRQMITGGTA